jgi:hypothetical protein
MKTITRKIVAVCVGLYLTGSVASYGNTFYTDLASGITTNAISLANNQEFGEQVALTTGFTFATLTNFSFQIYSTNAAYSGVTMDVQFLTNTGGTSNAPASVFYDSGSISLSTTQTFILGITVSGLLANTNVALQLYGAPTVGSSPGSYWVNTGSWSKYTNTITGPTYVGAQFLGVQTVPEPSVIYLGVAGMAALVGAIRLRRKS